MIKNRIEYISLASVLSAIAVVILHVNWCVLNFSLDSYWFSANLFHSIFIFAVPIFFMISGAMLLDFNKKYDLKTYIFKRINKSIIPYIVWSILGLLFFIFVLHTVNISDVNLMYIFTGLIKGNIVRPYWFFIPLFELYFLYIIFSRFSDNQRYLIILIIMTFIVNLLVNLKGITIVGYLCYALCGYYIHKYDINKNIRLILYLFSIIGVLIIFVGTCYLSMSSGNYVATFKDYVSIPVMVYSVGLFVFIKNNLVNIMDNIKIHNVVSFLDLYTFGIYLIHWFVIQFLIEIFKININSLIYRLLAPFLIILVCIGITYIIRKIPIVKRIVP